MDHLAALYELTYGQAKNSLNTMYIITYQYINCPYTTTVETKWCWMYTFWFWAANVFFFCSFFVLFFCINCSKWIFCWFCVLILIVTPPSLKAELALWKCRGGNLPQHLRLLANSRRQGQILMHFPPLHTQPVGHQKTEVLKLWNADHHEAQCLRYFIITHN
jgi:hypothetical protein